jgi:Ubiquitin fusion degradation protein UFD1
MDFEGSAQRLLREQSKLRGRIRNNFISEKAKREAEIHRRQQEQMKEKRLQEQLKMDNVKKVWRTYEQRLGVRQLAANGLFLRPTSIYGEGDKIALPPSVLEYLTSDLEHTPSPWTFRVGIRNPNYSFPESQGMKSIDPHVDDSMVEDSDDDDEYHNKMHQVYLDELSHKYFAYSHATVVEFTQDEGYVGLPEAIASSILNQLRFTNRIQSVKSMRTNDPSQLEVIDTDDNVKDRTPGHLAWGAFDLPDVSLEVSIVVLPKGKGCTLVPTLDAIKNGFHHLKNIKLVLEQSLVRTRATMSVGDTVHTWHRGVKYDLSVTSVTPATINSISCIDTDVVVDIGTNEEAEQLSHGLDGHKPLATHPDSNSLVKVSHDISGETSGRSLIADSSHKAVQPRIEYNSSPSTINTDSLIPEPPASQTDNVCLMQINAEIGSGRKRFDVTIATVRDAFAFAGTYTNLKSFQLVTRFPRKVLRIHDATLEAAGVQPGQELFIVEQL